MVPRYVYQPHLRERVCSLVSSKSGGVGTPNPVKTNEKGEIISWDSHSKDDTLLKLLLE